MRRRSELGFQKLFQSGTYHAVWLLEGPVSNLTCIMVLSSPQTVSAETVLLGCKTVYCCRQSHPQISL